MRFTKLLPLLATAALAVPATASATVYHTVRRGETITSVAATDGLSVSAVAAANGLSTTAELVTGSELIIPPRGGALTAPVETSGASAPAAAAAPSSAGGYVVPLGATLSGIAARFGTSVSALAAANDMSPDGILLAGRTLAISGASTDTAPAGDSASTSAPAESAEWVTPSEVGEIAEADGVSASLAEAIADEESGFNNDEVSRTGAIGVMQIEPGTWRDLTGPGGLPLSTDSALDNVRGGVALLRDLLGDTGGNETEAIAGYYQGLQSVRARGMFSGTRRYVADVLALQSRFAGT